MVIIFGHRNYGRVDGYRGEYAHTRFAHLYYMPLIPVSSFWVTREIDAAAFGFDIRTSARSVLATYLRWWGPLLAALMFAFAPGALGAIMAAPVVTAVVVAWRWRSVRNARALRRSDGDLAVFGSRCPPALMPVEMRQRVRQRLESHWSRVGGGRSPEDVVRFGARTAEESLVAYGLLRLAAIDHRDPAANPAADRLLDALPQDPVAASPYRGDDGVVFAAATDVADAETAKPAEPDARDDWSGRTLCAFGACVGVIGEDGACKECGKRPGENVEPTRPRPVVVKRWWMAPMPAAIRVAGAAVLFASIGLAHWGAPCLLPTKSADAAFLAREASSTAFVAVVCDEIQLIGTFDNGSYGYTCKVGDRLLPVVGMVENVEGGTTLIGELRRISDSEYKWPVDLYLAGSATSVTAGYLNVRSHGLFVLRRIAGVAGFGGLFGLAILIIIVIRRRRAAARRAVRPVHDQH